ncbi:TolC family protein [Bdellovibrionota bacterium FG-2]
MRFAPAGLAVVCYFVSAFAYASAPLTLSQAVEIALSSSPVMDSARRALLVSELQGSNHLSRFLPSADASVTQGFSGASPLEGQGVSGRQVSLSLTENLYDNGESLTQYRIGGLNQRIESLKLMKAREELCLSVAQRFFRLSLSYKVIEIKKQQLALLRKESLTTESLYRQGFKTRRDWLRFETQLQRAEIDLSTEEQARAHTILLLRTLLGRTQAENSQAAEFEFLPLEPKSPVSDLPVAGLDLRVTLDHRIAEVRREINSLTEQQAQRKRWPELNVSSGASYTNPLGSVTPNVGSYSWNALFSLRYNLWDWGIRRNDAVIATQNRVIQDNDLTLANLQLQETLSGLMLDLEKQKANYKLNEELLRLDEQSFAFLDEQYQSGGLSYLDLITAINDLSDARTRFYQMTFALLETNARYHSLEGKLYETLRSKR